MSSFRVGLKIQQVAFARERADVQAAGDGAGRVWRTRMTPGTERIGRIPEIRASGPNLTLHQQDGQTTGGKDRL